MNGNRTRVGLYTLILLFFTVIVIGINSIWYANHVAQQNNRKWCSLVVTMDDAYRQQPPTSPTGRKVAADMAALRRQFGCR